MAEALKRQVIIPTGQNMGWLKARESVKDKGGLPSNVLHDEYLNGAEARYKTVPGYYAAWAKEVLVYPQKGGQFTKGQDVVDAFKDNAGREWVFPASSMPEEAVGRQKVGLFVDPESVEVSGNRAVVLAKPQSVIILTPVIQQSGQMGLIDDKTGVPLEVAPEITERLSDAQKRWLWRVDGAGVRPLVRNVNDYSNRWRDVYAGGRHDVGYGVAYVGLAEAPAPKIAVAQGSVSPVQLTGFTLTREGGRLIVEGTPEQLDAAVRLLSQLNK